MTVLVTGANGHVGANLVRALIDAGRSVRALVRRETPALADLAIEQVRGDVLEPETLSAAFDGVDVVYHLAAMISIDGDHGGLVSNTNVEGPRNVAEAALAAGVRRMVHCSSVHAFDQSPLDQTLDETRAKVSRGALAYDASKAAGEEAVRGVIERGLDAVIVNPTGIIGPNDFGPSRMGEVFIDLYRRRLPASVAGGFDWVDVRDVVQGAMAAETKGRTGENYLLSGTWNSVAQTAALAQEVTGVPAPRLTAPMLLARVGAPFVEVFSKLIRARPLFTSESLAALRANRDISNEKARRELGFDPRPTRDSVYDVYRWFANAGMIEPNDRLQALVASR